MLRIWSAACVFALVGLVIASAATISEEHIAHGSVLPNHVLQKPFVHSASAGIPNWEFGGSAVPTENFIRLVPAIKSRRGHLWSSVAVPVREWQAFFEISVHNVRSPGADGMAFWYTKERMQSGPVYGNQENFVGLGILFDTFDNDGSRDGPIIMAVHSSDGSLKYDHDTDGVKASMARCTAKFRNTIEPVKMWVRYASNSLSVYYDLEGKGNYRECFNVPNLVLPDGYYFGFSAATGGFSDYADLFGFTVEAMSPSTSSSPTASVHPSETASSETAAASSTAAAGEGSKDFDFDAYKKRFLEKLKNRQGKSTPEDVNKLRNEKPEHPTTSTNTQQQNQETSQQETVKKTTAEDKNLQDALKNVMGNQNAESEQNTRNNNNNGNNNGNGNGNIQVDLSSLTDKLNVLARTTQNVLTTSEEHTTKIASIGTILKSNMDTVSDSASKVATLQNQVTQMASDTAQLKTSVKEVVSQLISLQSEVAKLLTMADKTGAEVARLRVSHGEGISDLRQRFTKFGDDVNSGSSVGVWLFVLLLLGGGSGAGWYVYKKRRERRNPFL